MLMVISPAKTLDMGPQKKTKIYSEPRMLDDSQRLVEKLRTFSKKQLSQLMGISEKLAEGNHQRFADWQLPLTTENAKQAIFAFRGDVYQGLAADQFKAAELKLAQRRLRILSGLYGVLRPLDLIQAYRLEMSTRLKTRRGESLYKFWGDRITDLLNEDLSAEKSDVLLNLASNEYFKAIQPKRLRARVITLSFKQEQGGQLKMNTFFAKAARGMVASFVIRNRTADPEDLKKADIEGYCYRKEQSTADQWLFARPLS